MAGTDYHTGGNGLSRSAEFTSGVTGSGGATHTVQQDAPKNFTPSSVLSPLPGTSGNGESPTTYSQNRMLNYYRS